MKGGGVHERYHTYIYIYKCKYNMYIYRCVDICVYIYIYTHVYIYIHLYNTDVKHTRVPRLLPFPATGVGHGNQSKVY